MKITEAATQAVLEVMKKKNLDHKKTYLEFAVNEGGLGVSFTQDRYGKVLQFGDLSVVIAQNIDSDGVVIDFGEVDGRKGLIFLGEENVRSNRNDTTN